MDRARWFDRASAFTDLHPTKEYKALSITFQATPNAGLHLLLKRGD
ncbi:MAG TPA: hypothetical protein VM943_03245 [Pyrinomonadaceae bacterium]|nr:hypothetical protein [Pyrinomonadaceae bacterium]